MGDLYSVVMAHLAATLKRARRIVVFVIGGSILLIGLVLLLLPGPAFVVIPTGLAILATEFLWARRLLHKARDKGMQLGNSVFSVTKNRKTPKNNEHEGQT